MNALNTLLLSAGLTTTLAALTVLWLGAPFLRLLTDVCRNAIHGKFWFVFACVSIVLTTLFGALSSFPTGGLASLSESSALEVVVASFRAGLLGLILSLAAVALSLVVSIGQRAPEPPFVRT